MAIDPHTTNLDELTYCTHLFYNTNSHITTCNPTYGRILYYGQDSTESYIIGGILIKSAVQIIGIVPTYGTQCVPTLVIIS